MKTISRARCNSNDEKIMNLTKLPQLSSITYKSIIAAFISMLCFLGTIQSVYAQTKVAFLVANSDYAHATSLKNPKRDVELIGNTLSELDFEVAIHHDLSRTQIGRELSEFLKDNKNADVTFFYFAGHGMQYENQNYLIGVDAKLETEFDIEAEAIDLDKIIQLMKKTSKASLVFIDACRDNPLSDQFYKNNFSKTRALMSRGLAPVNSTANGAMITFSAAPGQVAFDGVDYSPFAKSLARHLPSENTEVLSLMKRVIRDVKESSDNKQIPLISNDLSTEIYLKLDTESANSSFNFKQEEAMYNAAISVRSVRALDLYLQRFPSGLFRDKVIEEMENLQMLAYLKSKKIKWDDLDEVTKQEIKRQIAYKRKKPRSLTERDLKFIREAMQKRGYKVGPDGKELNNTIRKSIADFQLTIGLISTGVMNLQTAKALNLDLQGIETTEAALISSNNARKYDPDQLKLIEDDQRLLKAASKLKSFEYKYGFFDGRLYVAVISWGKNWQEANEIAQRVGGHLATISNQKENDFIYELFASDIRFINENPNDGQKIGPWIGLYQNPNSAEPRGGWTWVTGERLNYSRWAEGQPNNYGGKQQYASFHTHGRAVPHTDQRPIRWDDHDLEGGSNSFIIEIE
jgi:hypothetical protein